MKTVLVIAGYDPSGGAGILADVKTLAAMGCYGAAAITSVTYQNTQEVRGAEHQTAESLRQQLEPIFDDIEVHAFKTGMLPTPPLIEVTVEAARRYPDIPLVIDPVVRSTSGHDLIDDDALEALTSALLPLATLVTPNVAEAERITGLPVTTVSQMERAAQELVARGAKAALVTGGHLNLDGQAVDVLYDGTRLKSFERKRLESKATHGTGCTLASAIAAGLAIGRTLDNSIEIAKEYVTQAIRHAPGIGKGHGPLNHFYFSSSDTR